MLPKVLWELFLSRIEPPRPVTAFPCESFWLWMNVWACWGD